MDSNVWYPVSTACAIVAQRYPGSTIIPAENCIIVLVERSIDIEEQPVACYKELTRFRTEYLVIDEARFVRVATEHSSLRTTVA